MDCFFINRTQHLTKYPSKNKLKIKFKYLVFATFETKIGMRILIYCFSFLFFSSAVFANEDWGKNGHRAVAQIAESYLSNKARDQIEKLLEGESMATASTFADEIKSDSRYDEFNTWHYVNVDFDATYQTANKNPAGDLLQGIKTCLKQLEATTTSTEDKSFYLKMLIHLIADMHQPLHLGLEEDRGANDIKVTWFGNSTNLHRVWDTNMIESYNMSFTELAHHKFPLTEDEINIYQEGNLMDWFDETRILTQEVYLSAQDGDALGYAYSYQWLPRLRKQLHKAGIRLAQMLNELYG